MEAFAITTETFETRLVEALEPIRQHVLATMLYQLFSTGLYAEFCKLGKVEFNKIVESFDFEEQRLRGLFDYLVVENYLDRDENVYALTSKGLALADFQGWYTLLIGGYAGTFMQIGERLKRGTPWATRNATNVGIGSCMISHFDAIPLTRQLLGRIPYKKLNVLDLGCGNARYLIELCRDNPAISACGVEKDPGSYKDACQTVKDEGLSERIALYSCSMLDFLRSDLKFQPNVAIFGFILHEILSAEGEAGLCKMLKDLVARFPSIYVIAIEVDLKATELDFMRTGLARAYYNPYYLLHKFTNQCLMPREFWLELFPRCGFEILDIQTVNKQTDSTGLELGFLLKGTKS